MDDFDFEFLDFLFVDHMKNKNEEQPELPGCGCFLEILLAIFVLVVIGYIIT